MAKEMGPKEKAMREAREAKYAAQQPVKKPKPKKPAKA